MYSVYNSFTFRQNNPRWIDMPLKSIKLETVWINYFEEKNYVK